jgi:hypothetical protein
VNPGDRRRPAASAEPGAARGFGIKSGVIRFLLLEALDLKILKGLQFFIIPMKDLRFLPLGRLERRFAKCYIITSYFPDTWHGPAPHNHAAQAKMGRRL